jgi:hypothetical protein
MQVTLTWFESAMGAEVGRLRQLAALKDGLVHQYGFDGIGWTEHIEGACGEIAVAKYLGIYWGGSVNTFKSEDLGGGIQVRTRSRDDYDLIVRPGDNDDEIFVLVTGRCPHYTIRGWILGRDAKQGEFRADHGGRSSAYFVPQERLQCPSNLRSPSPSSP